MMRTQVFQILPDGRTSVQILNHITVTGDDVVLIVKDSLKHPEILKKVHEVLGSPQEKLVFVEQGQEQKTPEERQQAFLNGLKLLADEYARPSERDVLKRIIKNAEHRVCQLSSGPKT